MNKIKDEILGPKSPMPEKKIGVNVFKGRIPAGENRLIFWANGPVMLEYVLITNLEETPLVMNTYLEEPANNEQTHMCPKNLTLEKTQSFADKFIRIPDRHRYYIQAVNGSVDYYVSIKQDAADYTL